MTIVHAEPKPIVPLLPYQKADIESDARFTWSNWSRQVGKSFAKSFKRVVRGLQRRRNQILLSAGMRQSRELMEKVRMHCKALKIAAEYHRFDELVGEATYSVEQITMPGSFRIIALPANPDTARGFTGDVLLDEFAMHRHDREIWGALFPTVMRGEGELDICSTPKGKTNVFAQLRSNEMFHRTVVTIYDAVEQGLQVDPEALRRALGDEELWRQEFLCEFLDESLAFLTYEEIAACEDPGLEGPLEIRGGNDVLARAERFLTGIDSATGELGLGADIGRHHDLTCLWLLERIGQDLVTRDVVELRNVPFSAQWALLEEALRRRGISRCSIDATGLGMMLAERAVEQFGEWRIDPVTFTLATKEKLAGQLRMKVQDTRIRIPMSNAIRNDWHSIQKVVTTGGTVRYRAERTPDGHADRFWAAALAIDALSTPSGPAEYVGSETKLAFAREGIW